jgi:hypothetical protein
MTILDKTIQKMDELAETNMPYHEMWSDLYLWLLVQWIKEGGVGPSKPEKNTFDEAIQQLLMEETLARSDSNPVVADRLQKIRLKLIGRS